MDSVQIDFERGVGDRFVDWLNDKSGRRFVFDRRGDPAPDLIYTWQGIDLPLEIVAAYHDDQSHAEFLWKGARGHATAPDHWTGVNPSKSLAAAVRRNIARKCEKNYGADVVLLVEVPPGVTECEELALLLGDPEQWGNSPFAGIFVTGTFPMTSTSEGGIE